MPLRGHIDDSKYFSNPHHNAGTFQGLLQFRVQSGDKILADHFKTAQKKTQRSKTVQNQMMASCKMYMQGKIVEKIKRIRFFSIIADECSDVSNKEQLSLVLRYVNPDTSVICADFLAFLECKEGTSGPALATLIEREIEKMGLDMNNARGQCYDGAGNMKGIRKGVSSLFSEKYPKIIYFHCAGHKLNLCCPCLLSSKSCEHDGKCAQSIKYFSKFT